MSKELENLLRIVALIMVFGLIFFITFGRIRKLEKELDKYKNAPADTVTIVKYDTIKIDSPVPVYKYIKKNEYITITDSLVVVDTVTKFIQLPREYMVYKDTNYRAVVSGVDPRLDSIEVYKTTITNNITKYVPRKVKTFGTFVEGGVSVNARDNKEMMWSAGAGVIVKQKVGAALEWQHNMQTKQDFIGGRLIIQF